MPSEKHQQQARKIARDAGIPNRAILYPRIIEHFAAALEAVERETALRCAEINAAIRERWNGKRALPAVKEMAWKHVEGWKARGKAGGDEQRPEVHA